MKRNVDGCNKHLNWELCILCQRFDGGKLTGSGKSRDTLATNLSEIWDLDSSKIDINCDTFVRNNNGKPDFSATFERNDALFHHDCASRYNKQKINRIKDRQKKQKTSSSISTRSSSDAQPFASLFCAICNGKDVLSNLRAAGSKGASNRRGPNSEHDRLLTERWREMALKTGKDSLLALLSSGSLISNEIWYHLSCYSAMVKNYERVLANKDELQHETNWMKATCFESVISYLIDQEQSKSGSIFAVRDLNNMYIEMLWKYGIEEREHTTRFQEKLLKNLPDLYCTEQDGKSIVMFDQQVRQLITDHVETPDEFCKSLRKVVFPIRKEIFDTENKFDGHFDTHCQSKSVPRKLLLLVSALIEGTYDTAEFSQEALTVAQLITSQASRHHQKSVSSIQVARRHTKKQETPIMLYNALKIYTMTNRSRSLVDHFFHLGMCISYDRILEITQNIYENLRESYFNFKCFFPNILRKLLFTILLKDNVDVNSRSNFIQSHYHGTSISVIQFVTEENPGIEFPETNISTKVSSKSKKLSPLPKEYINVQKLFPETKSMSGSGELWAPLCCVNISIEEKFMFMDGAVNDELVWLNLVMQTLNNPDDELNVPGWARHHSSCQRKSVDPPGINTISPLLRDKVNTLNMQAHCMLMNINSVKVLNPGQTPVDVCDEPLVALSKEAQWRFPLLFQDYVVLFGGLHIEQSLLGIHGRLIDGSGLLEILNQHKFTTLGVSGLSMNADVNSIKRARYCIQVTLCALYTKLCEAVQTVGSTKSPYQWLSDQAIENDSCFYWKMVMDFQIHLLVFVRSIREGNFELYIESLRTVIKWSFALDRINYARYLSIHIFDLMTMETNYPDVYQNLTKGFFSFQKSNNEFSRMALDQVHEQNNRVIKSIGGASDLVNKQNDSSLIRWETCGPDIARIITEFEESEENSCLGPRRCNTIKHHEDNDNFCKDFTSDINTLLNALPYNPFQADKLHKINDEKILVPETKIEQMKIMAETGENQFLSFIRNRLIFQKEPISAVIHKNGFKIWDFGEVGDVKPFGPTKSVVNKMRSACEHRLELAKTVFASEIMDVPQSLAKTSVSEFHGKKSEITKRFTSCINASLPVAPVNAKTAIVVEMSPIIRARCLSLNDNIVYMCDLAVLLYYHVLSICFDFPRIDLVFDRYFERSVKEDMRVSRGTGSRFIFTEDSVVPKAMDDFLMNSQNKNDLNEFLAKRFIEIHHGKKILIVTYRDTVICSCTDELTTSDEFIKACQSEEADQRLVRHALHCLLDPLCERVVVRTIDTDVLMILIRYVAESENVTTKVYAELINSAAFYDIRQLVSLIGPEICGALLFFYAFTGCDIVSSFFGKGKCKAWDMWLNSINKQLYTDLFTKLGDEPATITDSDLDILEMFVIELYALSRQKVLPTSLASMRLENFRSTADDDLRKLPPSRAALCEHSKRACYQAGFLWKEATKNVTLPDPSEWGWNFNLEKQIYQPLWQRETCSVSIEQFTATCKCYKQKCRSCKCKGMQCISICGCKRSCCKEN